MQNVIERFGIEGLERPAIEPGQVLKWLRSTREQEGLHPRVVSTAVTRYIGESTVPAKGRGSARKFSLKDMILFALGLALDNIGLPNYNIRLCVEAVRDKWDLLVPIKHASYFLLTHEDWATLIPPEQRHFLIGKDIKGQFQARVVAYEQAAQELLHDSDSYGVRVSFDLTQHTYLTCRMWLRLMGGDEE
ncbi:MAG: hypothetical protein AB1646_21320 [Thermodesulfobacteriota bacterium]